MNGHSDGISGRAIIRGVHNRGLSHVDFQQTDLLLPLLSSFTRGAVVAPSSSASPVWGPRACPQQRTGVRDVAVRGHQDHAVDGLRSDRKFSAVGSTWTGVG